MRMAVVGQAVGADHAVRISDDAAHVRLVHHEVDAARRAQLRHGGDRVEAELGSGVGEVAARVIRMLLGPGDDHPLRLLHHLRQQHRGACGVGIDIKADGLALAGLIEQRERVAAPPEVLAAGALVVGDDDAGAGAAADLEGFLHRLLDAVMLVSHMGDGRGRRRRRRPRRRPQPRR